MGEWWCIGPGAAPAASKQGRLPPLSAPQRGAPERAVAESGCKASKHYHTLLAGGLWPALTHPYKHGSRRDLWISSNSHQGKSSASHVVPPQRRVDRSVGADRGGAPRPHKEVRDRHNTQQISPYFNPTYTRTGWIGQPPVLDRHEVVTIDGDVVTLRQAFG